MIFWYARRVSFAIEKMGFDLKRQEFDLESIIYSTTEKLGFDLKR